MFIRQPGISLLVTTVTLALAAFLSVGPAVAQNKTAGAISQAVGNSSANTADLRARGMALLRGEKFKAAEDAFTQLLSTGGINASDLYFLGQSYYHEHKYKEAARAFSSALDADPRQESSYQYLAQSYMASREQAQAQEVCRRGLAAVKDPQVLAQLKVLAKLSAKPALLPPLNGKSNIGHAG